MAIDTERVRAIEAFGWRVLGAASDAREGRATPPAAVAGLVADWKRLRAAVAMWCAKCGAAMNMVETRRTERGVVRLWQCPHCGHRYEEGVA